MTWSVHRVGDDAIGVDVHTLRAVEPGPRVVVLAGVHGNEINGILAAGALTSAVGALQRGSLTVVPVTHEAANRVFGRESPLDDQNLARCFPGEPDGSPTQRLAWLVDTQVIAHADFLVDLHTSSPAADMPLFVGCLGDGSELSSRAMNAALSMGFPVLWTHPDLATGRTLSAAHARNIPCLYVESPVGGMVDEYVIGTYVAGVRGIMRSLGLLAGDVPVPLPQLWLHGDGDADAFSPAGADGFFVRRVALLDRVVAGQVVGVVVDALGAVLAEVRAPATGRVATLQRSAAVSREQPVVGVADERIASWDVVSTVAWR